MTDRRIWRIMSPGRGSPYTPTAGCAIFRSTILHHETDRTILRQERVLTRFFKLLLVVTCGILLDASLSNAQTRPASSGSDFILNLPHLYLDSDADLLISVTAVTSGWVSIIENERGDSTSRFLPADSAWHFRIPRNVIGFPLQEEGRSRRSARVRSTGLVTVQGAYDGDYVTDSWLVPPVKDLGRSHTILSIWNPSTSGGVFTVAATEDSTTIRVTPSVPTSRGSPGFSYGITLDAGEVWQVVPSVPEFTDISGSRVESDKPVFVLGGHAGGRLFGRGANNPMIEWMPPLSHWGEYFVAAPYPRRPEGLYKILADQDGTRLNVNNVTIDTLDAGESRWWIDQFPVTFSSSSPILIAQFVDHRDTSITTQDGDPSMTILQPVRAWSRSYLWQTLELPSRFVQTQGSDAKLPFDDFLVVSADFSNGVFPIMLDGRDISSFISRTIGGTGYSIGWIPMTSETHHLESQEPVSAQVLGFNVFDAYAHPVGYPVPPLVDIPDLFDTLCTDQYRGELQVKNRTDETVVVDSFKVRNGATIGLTPGSRLSPRSSLSIAIVLSLPVIGPHSDTLTLYVHGEKTGRSAVAIATIEVMRLPLSLMATPEQLEFSTATPAEPELLRTVTLYNDGTLPLRLDDIEIDEPFSLAPGQLPVDIGAGDSARLEISYRPTTFPARDSTVVSLTTSPCSIFRTLRLIGHADVERVPTIDVDTLRSFCDGDYGEQIISILNGTAYDISLDSLDLPDGIELMNDPSPSSIQSGDKVEVGIRWLLVSRGLNRKNVSLFLNERVEASMIELIHILGSPSVEVTPRVVDLGTITTCATADSATFSFDVVNSGDVAIDSIQILSATGRSVIPTPIVENLKVGASISLTAYLSGPEGTFTDTIFVLSRYCDEVDTLVVRGLLVSPGISVAPERITLQGSLSCDFPQKFSLTVVNNSSRPDTLTGLESSSGNLYTGGISLPLLLLPGESTTLTVDATPMAPTIVIDTLYIVTARCNGRVGIPVELQARSTDWSLSADSIVIDDLLPGNPRSTNVRVLNNGQLPVTIEGIELTPPIDGVSVNETIVGTTIPAGSSASIDVTYDSRLPRRFETILEMKGTECVQPLKLVVTGVPGTIPIQLGVEGSDRNVDDILRLPILLRSDRLSAGPATIRFQIAWENRGLHFQGLRSAEIGELVVLRREIVALKEIIFLEYSGYPPETGTDTVGWLDIRLLLADRESWVLQVSGDSISGEANAVQYEVSYLNDSVNLADLCRIDGPRLVRLQERLYPHTIIPHPVKDGAVLTVYSAYTHSLSARITIVDILGDSKQEFSQILVPGDNDIVLDLSAEPQGTYQVVIESGSERVSREVVRQ